ncbi:hypothetical protein Ndes2526B_g02915 [Nannochloris sp. 'desiccata']|nr:hypothetical protein KSW81_006832 [Chlorella desiccata (nom. nud.)]KAH7622090.1 hypothetical protein NADE_004681 [Chlorella desiccata (nom. nud.)]
MCSENQSKLPLTEPLSPLVPQAEVVALREECETLRHEASRLRSALDQEQAHRQRLEQECAADRQRAERYYLDRQDYKQHLREAASAYQELKTAYRRIKSSTITIKNPNTIITTAATEVRGHATVAPEEEQDKLEESPTQALPVEEQNWGFPLLTQRNNPHPVTIKKEEVNVVKEEEEEVDEESQAVANINIIVDQPSSNSPKHRPAWKKAVRTRRLLEGGERKDKNEEEEGEDIFLQPQAKKWAPDRPAVARQQAFTAQARVAPSNLPNPEAPPRQQQQQQRGQSLPNGAFKHQEVIRKRKDREKLEGFECQDCKRFYDAMEKWGAIGVLPQCQHHVNPKTAAARAGAAPVGNGAALQQQARQANLRNELRAGASRHRYLFEPPLTPKGFWDLGFSPPKNASQEEAERVPSRPSSAPDSFNSHR